MKGLAERILEKIIPVGYARARTSGLFETMSLLMLARRTNLAHRNLNNFYLCNTCIPRPDTCFTDGSAGGTCETPRESKQEPLGPYADALQLRHTSPVVLVSSLQVIWGSSEDTKRAKGQLKIQGELKIKSSY